MPKLYDVRRNQRIGTAKSDVLLLSKKRDRADVIVEIRYFRKAFGQAFLWQTT
jgi:hypothetical protein